MLSSRWRGSIPDERITIKKGLHSITGRGTGHRRCSSSDEEKGYYGLVSWGGLGITLVEESSGISWFL